MEKAAKKKKKNTKKACNEQTSPPSPPPPDAASDADGSEEEEGSLEVGACCLCQCALDYSDRAAFFREDREVDYNDNSDEEEYFFRRKDPYLPKEFYNPSNALVYCDSCDRMFHQQCHFVPLLTLPRGVWHCMPCQSKADPTTSTIFRSPPNTTDNDSNKTRKLVELKWEAAQASRKAAAMKQECRKLTQYCQSQLGNLRLATTKLETLTSTSRNMSHFFKHSSQELAQTLLQLASAKYKLRQAVLSLEQWRRDGGASLAQRERLADFCKKQKCSEEFVTRILFPFGVSHPIRTTPRTGEAAKAGIITTVITNPVATTGTIASVVGIPSEVVCDLSSSKSKKSPTKKDKGKNSSNNKKDNDRVVHDDDDDGVSVDDLTCAVCWESTATDTNDLVLCDGRGCYRTYHMNCLQPHLNPEDLNESDDWFCPICTAIAKFLHWIQTEYYGDEWELKRHQLQAANMPCDGSLKSWEGVEELFPESEWEYETAQKLLKRKRDADTQRLLAQALGLDEDGNAASGRGDDDDDDHDDDDDDDHFDPDAFEKDKQKERGDDDDDSTRSSQVTLVEMSSVELDIGRDELAALSDEDEDDEESSNGGESSGSVPCTRKSRRLAKKAEGASTTGSDDDDNSNDIKTNDPGKLDERNILPGKRNRNLVDYRRLNDALFGDLPDAENAKIDAGEDFEPTKASTGKKRKKKKNSLSSKKDSQDNAGASSDNESNTSSNDDDDDDPEEQRKRAKGTGREKKALKTKASVGRRSDINKNGESSKTRKTQSRKPKKQSTTSSSRKNKKTEATTTSSGKRKASSSPLKNGKTTSGEHSTKRKRGSS